MTNFDDYILIKANDTLQALANNKAAFLTGGPGTGKSTIVRHLMKHHDDEYEFIVLAPTNIAALNVNGATIHSTFMLKPGVEIQYKDYHEYMTSVDAKSFMIRQAVFDNLSKVGDNKKQCFVFDEVSMMSATMLDFLITLFDYHKINPVLLFVGDFYQLPPVVGKFCYHSNFWQKNIGQHMIRLDKNLRNEEEDFNKFLTSIRTGHFEIEAARYLKNLMQNEVDEDETIHLVGTNRLRKQINEKYTSRIDAEEMIFRAEILSNRVKHTDFDTMKYDYDLKLKIGMNVVFIDTDKEAGYYNGMQGVVENILGNTIHVKIFKNGFYEYIYLEKKIVSRTKYKRDKATKKMIEEEESLFKQFPITPAYAMTIHKSQGMSLDNITIHLNSFFEKGQFFVALSRATNSENLVVYLEDFELTNDDVFDKDTFKNSSFMIWLKSQHWLSESKYVNRNIDLLLPLVEVDAFYNKKSM